MKHKQRGSVSILITIVITCVVIFVGAYMSLTSMSLQEVEELDKKCQQAHGETLLVTNKSDEVKYVRCRKDGAVYVDF